MRLIIDTDAGIDDAGAIMLALTSSDVDVEAITMVCGNCSLDKVIKNVSTVLDVLDDNTPIYAGAVQPLVAAWSPELIHGDDGLGNYTERPSSTRRVEEEHAALTLIRLANKYPGELSLVALAPLTNIALATRLDPTFPSKIKSIMMMGGAIHARGNTNNVAAEWNIYCDPEAAHIVFESFSSIQLVSWETALDFPLLAADYDQLISLPTSRARLFERINRIFMPKDAAGAYKQNLLLIDVLAMALALEPSAITDSLKRYVAIELHGTHTRGQTVIDHTGRLKKPANVEMITGIDMAHVVLRLKAMLT